MDHKKNLLARIEKKSAIIGVVGLGYVGLPLVLQFTEEGYRVIGIDIDAEKVAKLKRGQSYIRHIPAAALARARRAGFEPTADFRPAPGAGPRNSGPAPGARRAAWERR